MPDGWNFDFGFVTSPTPPAPATYIAPKAKRPEILVDQYRVMLMDPATQTMVGMDGSMGAGGNLGRLVYAGRTSSNRGF